MVPAVLRLVCEVQSMREIKFRGKDSDNGQWRYGFYLRHSKVTLCPIYENEEEFKKAVAENDEHYIVFDGFSDWNLPRGFYRADVDEKTVGQYTGVHDRNGKEVYEGDIVVTYLKRKYVITWIDKYARFAFWKPDIDFASGLYNYGQFEVIGNIHENPELLGGVHDEH